MFEDIDEYFDEENEDSNTMSLKDFITASPDDLCFAGVSDTSVEIIDEANGKITSLDIKNLQSLIQDFIKYRSQDTRETIEDMHIFEE